MKCACSTVNTMYSENIYQNYSTNEQRRSEGAYLSKANVESQANCRHTSSDESAEEVRRQTFPCSNPCTPRMREYSDRLASFRNWQNHIKAKPSEMADAGFLYLGTRDKVKCFYCNGGLQNWKYDEEPWFEHSKWYPNCEYVLRRKGLSYVQNIACRYPNLNRPSIHNPLPENTYENLLPITSPSTSTMGRVTIASDSASSSSANPVKENFTEKRLNEAMQTEIVKEAVQFQFDLKMIRNVVKRKLEQDGTEYTSVMCMVEDLQEEEEEMKSASILSCKAITERDIVPDEEMDTVDSIPALSVPDLIPNQSAGLLLQGAPRLTKVFPKKVQSLKPLNSWSINSTGESDNMSGDEIDDKIRSLVDEQTCKVCLDRKIDCLFRPCNHLCCCTQCASVLTACPVCRTNLERIMKVYRY